MLFLTFFIATFLLLVAYFYFKTKYFTLRGPVPGLPPHFLLGNLLQTGILWRDEPLPMVFLDLKKKFGDAYQFWMGPMRVVAVGNLEDAQHIFSHRHIYDQGVLFTKNFSLAYPNALICLEGAKYKRHAAAISFLFRRSKILPHFETIVNCTDKFLNRWRTNFIDPEEIHTNIVEQCQHLLLAIFGFIAFDFDLQTLNDEHCSKKHELTEAFTNFLDVFPTIVKAPLFIGRIYLFFNRKFQQSRVIIHRYIYQMIEQELGESDGRRIERRRTSLVASLVSLLQKHETTKTEEQNHDVPVGLSHEEMLDEILFLLSAGYGTTATAVTWFIHLMSKNPRIQRKLKTELKEKLNEHFTVDQLESCFYLDCVVREILRFVPPSVGTIRTLTSDDRLPSTGVELKKGEHVFIPIYNFTRDERYWRGAIGPEQFYPERFENDPDEKLNTKAALFTFGGGHRQCVGQDLARFELKIICARLMQNVTFTDGGAQVNAGGYLQRETILPKHVGVKISFD